MYKLVLVPTLRFYLMMSPSANKVLTLLKAQASWVTILAEATKIGMEIRKDCLLGTAEQWDKLEEEVYGSAR